MKKSKKQETVIPSYLISLSRRISSSYRDLTAIFSFLWDVQSLQHPRVYRVVQLFSLHVHIHPVVDVGSGRVLLPHHHHHSSARHETSFSDVMCARRLSSSSSSSADRQQRILSASLEDVPCYRRETAESLTGGPSVRKRTRTERIDADF